MITDIYAIDGPICEMCLEPFCYNEATLNWSYCPTCIGDVCQEHRQIQRELSLSPNQAAPFIISLPQEISNER